MPVHVELVVMSWVHDEAAGLRLRLLRGFATLFGAPVDGKDRSAEEHRVRDADVFAR